MSDKLKALLLGKRDQIWIEAVNAPRYVKYVLR